ncbi:MAG TPA: hypothetical protein PKH93_01005 [Chitinophagales bacterium]|nr:hypothetical protein [Chitinophagales bacterium]
MKRKEIFAAFLDFLMLFIAFCHNFMLQNSAKTDFSSKNTKIKAKMYKNLSERELNGNACCYAYKTYWHF